MHVLMPIDFSPWWATLTYFLHIGWKLCSCWLMQSAAHNNLYVKKGIGVRGCVRAIQTAMNSSGDTEQELFYRFVLLLCWCGCVMWGVGVDVLLWDHCVLWGFQTSSSVVAVILIMCGWQLRLEGWHSWAWVTMTTTKVDGQLCDKRRTCTRWLL